MSKINLETNVQHQRVTLSKPVGAHTADARSGAAEARTEAEKRRLESQRKVAEFQSKTKARTRASKAKATPKDAVSKALEDAAAATAEKVNPAFQTALDAVGSIGKHDIKDILLIKNLHRSSPVAAKVIDAVSILMTGEEGVVAARKLLAEPSFLGTLQKVGPESIKASRVQKFRSKYMDKEGKFPSVEESARNGAGTAAMCAWVLGIHQCAANPPPPFVRRSRDLLV